MADTDNEHDMEVLVNWYYAYGTAAVLAVSADVAMASVRSVRAVSASDSVHSAQADAAVPDWAEPFRCQAYFYGILLTHSFRSPLYFTI